MTVPGLTCFTAPAVIGPDEGHLIALTRLEDVPLQQVADHLDITTGTARAWRARADKALQQAITAGDRHWVNLPGLANRWVPAASGPTNPTPTTGH